MRFPRLPDWLIYTAAAGLILWGAAGLQERADAPPPPPPVPGEEAMPLGPASPFDPAGVVHPRGSVRRIGTAFSVSDQGLWLTARHVVEGCRRVVLIVAEGRGVATDVAFEPGEDLAILTTAGGAPALGLGDARGPRVSARGFHPGFPQGQPGEATSRYLGRETLKGVRRTEHDQHVMAWAESGRTDGIEGALNGLSGAPVLDAQGRVIGVTLSESPRRARLYAVPPEAVIRAVAAAGVKRSAATPAGPVTVENYGRVADMLRRSLSVTQVVCL